MAQKRMFSLEVINTDEFAEMPITSRLLYYELGMRADDDGFVGNWKLILKMSGLTEDDMRILIAKRFVIAFDSGVIVIRHWRINNYLRNDRHHETRYKDELEQLSLDNDVYELESAENTEMLPSGRQVVNRDKNSIDKNSIDKNSIDKVNISSRCTKKFVPPTIEEVREYINLKGITNVNAEDFLDYFTTGNWVDAKGQHVKNWKQKLLTWHKMDLGNTRRQQPKVTSNPFMEILLEQGDNDGKGEDNKIIDDVEASIS